MSYRPITDFWFLARAKLKDGEKYYGAYLGGFPERARILLGCSLDDCVLHVCGGKARLYPYARGFGRNDMTLDIDPAINPDIIHDARLPFPKGYADLWRGVLIDPPYSIEDAAKYTAGAAAFPTPTELLRNALAAVPVGHKVGIILYGLPKMPKHAKFVAVAAIACGFGNRGRFFSVFERTE